jgi:hypothetical protein
MGLDVANGLHRARITQLLKSWVSTSMLTVVDRLDENRDKRAFIEVGTVADSPDIGSPRRASGP